MRGWGGKEAIGCLFWIVVIVWLLVQCTGGDKDKTDSLHTTTKMTTFLAQDIATYNKGQEAMNTGDTSIFYLYMQTSGVIRLEEGTALYIQDVSLLKGYVKATVTSGIYKGTTGYVPRVSINK